jgi:radical SAM superfamily enzyme YgiQ (UPF0313 family)
LPDVKLLAGGYHVTLMHHEIVTETPEVPLDFMVRGEGEATFRELVTVLDASCGDISVIQGLSWRNGEGRWIHNPERPLQNLAELPLPQRGIRLETGFHVFRKRVDVVETSRGCPLQCNFCSIRKMYGTSFRPFPVARIIADLQQIQAAGTEFVFFSDDNITYNVDHFGAICRAIIDNGLAGMIHSIQASAYGIAKNPEIVALMDEANIRVVSLGLESMDPDSFKFMKKATSIEINREAMRLLKQHNIAVNALFIIGFPEDTRESIHTSFRNLLSMKPDTIYCQFMTPYPKTEVREELLAAGLVENSDDLTTYDGYHCNIRTRHLSQKELWDAFSQEMTWSFWPLATRGNFYLKRKDFRWGFLMSEAMVLVMLLYRMIRGNSRDWRLEL